MKTALVLASLVLIITAQTSRSEHTEHLATCSEEDECECEIDQNCPLKFDTDIVCRNGDSSRKYEVNKDDNAQEFKLGNANDCPSQLVLEAYGKEGTITDEWMEEVDGKPQKKDVDARNEWGHTVRGFQIDMGTRDMVYDKQAGTHKAIYYGKAWVWLNIPYVKPIDENQRFLLAVQWNNKNKSELEGLLKNRNKQDGAFKHRQYAKFGSKCKQRGAGEENCLTINVFAPPIKKHTVKGKEEIVKRPVYVHIHGGALTSNSAEEFGYRGLIRNLVSQEIVVVTFNYRLGAYGFLEIFNRREYNQYSKDYKDLKNYRINVGLEDSIMALEWVKRNIAGFGGNESHITVGGDSAGATSIEYIALALNRRGLKFDLFHRMILLGGSADLCTKSAFVEYDLEDKLKDEVCKGTSGKDLWDCFRRPNTGDLSKKREVTEGKKAGEEMPTKQHPKEWEFWGVKTPDVSMEGHPRFENVARGIFEGDWKSDKNIEVLMIESRDEWALFDNMNVKPEAMKKENGETKEYSEKYLQYTIEHILKPYDQIYGNGWSAGNAKDIAVNIINTYIHHLDSKVSTAEDLTEAEHYTINMRAVTNYMWSTRMLEDALRLKKRGHQVYMMRFAHEMVEPLGLKGTKRAETPFLHQTGRDHARAVQHGQETRYGLMHEKHWNKPEFQRQEELKVADKMADVLGNFIYNGDPGNPKRSYGQGSSWWQLFSWATGMGGLRMFELYSKHATAEHSFYVKIDSKKEWLSQGVLDFWCDFFQKNGQAPFTMLERKLKGNTQKRAVAAADYAICEHAYPIKKHP
ncbi:carboxylesterase family domain-containing protein [Ditylenchus destructor]|nr:carboxylesterase family domain-containing protein [Ditylenchus destructor]